MKTMNNNTSAKSASAARISNLLDLHGPEIKVYQSYVRLNSEGRNTFKDLLLLHAALPDGANAYVNFGRWNESDRRWAYLLLMSNASADMASDWYDWAFAMSLKKMSAAARRDTILRSSRSCYLTTLSGPTPSAKHSIGSSPRQRGDELQPNGKTELGIRRFKRIRLRHH